MKVQLKLFYYFNIGQLFGNVDIFGKIVKFQEPLYNLRVVIYVSMYMFDNEVPLKINYYKNGNRKTTIKQNTCVL